MWRGCTAVASAVPASSARRTSAVGSKLHRVAQPVSISARIHHHAVAQARVRATAAAAGGLRRPVTCSSSSAVLIGGRPSAVLAVLQRRTTHSTSGDDPERQLRQLAERDTCTTTGPLREVEEAPTAAGTTPSDDSAPERTSLLDSYLALSKARLSLMVVATAAAGFLAAPFEPTAAGMLALSAACAGTALSSAGANTFNQLIETSHDSLMNRTKKRPLPAGLISRTHAFAFGSAVSVAGVSLLYTVVNPVAAALAASNIVLYAGVYTPSKRVTVLNTWIGAVVGAIPPLIGWAAACDGELHAGAWALATVLYVWQLPHFLALSWGIKQDYSRAGYKMLASVSPELVPRQTLYWTVAMLPLGALCSLSGISTMWFAVDSTVASGYLLYLAKKFDEDHSAGSARKLFLSTLWWLPLFIVLMLAHKRKRNPSAEDEEEDEDSQKKVVEVSQ